MLMSSSRLVRSGLRQCGAGVLGAVLLAGCGRGDIKVYRVAKNEPASTTSAAGDMPPGHPDIGSSPTAAVTWKTPPGWQELPASEMRVGSFSVKGESGQKADVSIIPLAGMAGGDFANVNRWRGQVGASALSEDELKSQAQRVDVGGQEADLYDVAGKNPASGDATRILGVIQHRDNTAWFVKMTGDDVLVEKQKPAFVDFLKSLHFGAGGAAAVGAGAMGSGALPPDHPPITDMGMSSPATPAPAAEGTPDWQVPPGWQSVAAGQFLVAKFTLSGGSGAQAAVNVSTSAGDGGGLANNVNRWRKQLGLGEWSAAELKQSIATVDVVGGQASLVDLSGTDSRSGQPARLVGAIVPRGDQTWFYKLMGDDAVVARERSAFTNFVQTAKY